MSDFYYVIDSDGGYITDSQGYYIQALTIDNFEDGDHSGWTIESSTGSDTIVSPGLNGSNNAWEHSGVRDAHLAGADAVDRGPQPGDRFEFWFRLESTSGTVINRFDFSADGNNDSDHYRFEFQRSDDPGDEWRLEKWSSGSVVKDVLESGAPSVGQAYRVQIDWNRGSSDITAQVFLPNGDTVTSPITITDDSSSSGSEYTQPGIHIRTNSNNTCTWDEFRITES